MSRNILSLSVVDKLVGSAPYMCQGDFAARIHYAAQLGYTGIEINIADPQRLQLQPLREALAQTGLRITAFGTGRAYVNEGISLTDPDKVCRALAMQRLHTFLRLGEEFDCPIILGCIRGNVYNGNVLQALELLAKALQTLEADCGARTSAMVLEPINRYENNFLCNVADASCFITQAGLRKTKILMDTFHMNIEDPDPKQVIEQFGHNIAYVHIADSNRKFPGCGHTDFNRIFQALAAQDYHGAFCAECHADGDFDVGCSTWLSRVQSLLQNTFPNPS